MKGRTETDLSLDRESRLILMGVKFGACGAETNLTAKYDTLNSMGQSLKVTIATAQGKVKEKLLFQAKGHTKVTSSAAYHSA